MNIKDLEKYGITGTTEIVYNPTYEQLFEAEMDPTLEGFDKGQLTELGAVNVMTIATLPTFLILLNSSKEVFLISPFLVAIII